MTTEAFEEFMDRFFNNFTAENPKKNVRYIKVVDLKDIERQSRIRNAVPFGALIRGTAQSTSPAAPAQQLGVV
jgi:hypothetical protein